MAKLPPVIPGKTTTKTTWAHPAKKLLLISILCLFLAVLLGFITVFVPWSRKDTNATTRVWAYPFQNCAEDLASVRPTANQVTCQDNDFSDAASVSGGNEKCRGFIIATIVNVFIYVLIGIFTLIFLGLALKSLWGKALPFAALGVLGLLICCGGAIAAWACWIVYAEEVCTVSALFPVQGYSYGFIMTIFASVLDLIALVAAILATLKIKKGAIKDHQVYATPAYIPAQPYVAAPAYPTSYPQVPAYPGPITSPYYVA
jgi:hypothetical protein